MDINVPKKLMNGTKRKPHPNLTNWQFAALALNKATTKVSLPRKVNLKDKFPPVYDQIYGNCTANAVLACDAYYYHNPKGTWIPSTTFTYYNQRKMDHAGFEEDDGSSVETGLNAVRKYGACNSTVWANNVPFDKKPSEEAYKDGLKGHEVTKYYAVKSLLQIKKALNSGYPVAISMTWAFTSIDTTTYFLNNPTNKEVKKCDLGHAVVIVGYDDDRQAVEIRNSWGSNWGNNGYAYVSYDALQKCIWYDDAYAVVK